MDWVEKSDPKSGKTYYYNKKTKETSWKKPKELEEKPAETTAESSDAKAASSDESADWVEKSDPKSGKTYYYNKKTKETSWKKPKGVTPPPAATKKEKPAADAAASATSDWVEKADPKSGKTYFYNKKTKETSWKKPKELEAAAAEAADGKEAADEPKSTTAAADAEPAAAASADALPAGWVEKTDPKTGKKYFYHKETKQTSWKRPKPTTPPPSESKSAANEASAADEKQVPSGSSIPAGTPRPKGDAAENASSAKSDWVEKADPKSGKTYFYNKKTKETSWKKPKELEAAADKPADVKQDEAKPAASGEAANWVEKKDPKSGKTYFYNKKTKETSWKKPKELEAAAAAPAKQDEPKPAPASDWVEKSDPKSGKTYFYNKKTKETSWKKPKELEAAAQQPPAESKAEPASDWVEKSDPKSGKTYFYNKKTKETSWKKPKELEQAAASSSAAADATEIGSDDGIGSDDTVNPVDAGDEETDPTKLIEAALAQLGPEWKRGFEHKTDTIYAFNEYTGERRWLDPIMGEFTAVLRIHEIPDETVFVIAGDESGKQRQNVKAFMGTHWVTLSADQHLIPYDFHSVTGIRTGPTTTTMIGMRRDVGGAYAAVNWDAARRLCVLQNNLLPTHHQAAGYAAVPRGLVVAGGSISVSGSLNSTEVSDAAFVHDMIRGSTHELPLLNTGRTSHTLSIVDVSNEFRLLWYAYVVGGFDGKRKTASVERYVLGGDKWEYVAPLRAPRSGHAAFTIDKSIYVVGGRLGYTVTNTMEFLHAHTDSWTAAAPMRTPRASFDVARCGNFYLAVGGLNGAQWLASVEAYDPRIDVWRDVAALPSPCACMYAVTLKHADALRDADIAEDDSFSDASSHVGRKRIDLSKVYL